MKQGRLSFSTKRKDRAGEIEDVVVIEESPEKPPTKKVCRMSIAEPGEKVEETDPPECKEKSSPKPDHPSCNGKSSPRSDPAVTSNDSDDAKLKEAENSGNGSEDIGDPTEKAEKLEDSAEIIDLETKSLDESEHEEGSDGDGEEVMEVSVAESSMLDSTIESVAEDGENDDKSDSTTPTAPKRARLSKTEAAYRSLKHKKDKEYRQKERDVRLKQKQEEKERREQERKELRDRKEKERLERERKKEEERTLKEKEREEREKKKEEERIQREKERIEKEKKKEEERQLREKERLEKEKEKEEKEKLRKEKEDERRRREEEKKRELEEESAKKEKAKQAFMSFFLKRPVTSSLDSTKDPTALGGDSANDDESHRAENVIKFRPFQLKKDMKLAPIVSNDAKNRFDKSVFESKLQEQNATADDLYIKLLRRGYKPLKSKTTKSESQEAEDQDVIVITRFNGVDDESTGGRMRAKFLHFCENYRPAYYGTWRKKCSQINGRKPFNKYSDFDYTVDSDDEWEEGEGESLAGTDDEKEDKDEVEEDYEEDDFLVPHGYLSESEEDEEDDQPMDPEALKARIAARQEEFKADRKTGLQKKKVVAVCSLGPDGVALQEEIKVLSQFKAVLMVANGLQPSWELVNEIIINSKDAEPAVLTGKALELFCRTAHGFQGGTRALHDTFLQKWKAVSDVRVNAKSLKMTQSSCCKKSKSLNALVVEAQLAEKFGLENLETDTAADGTPQYSRYLPDDVIPELIKVTQGNSNSSQILEDFLALMTHRKFGKAQVKRTLANIGEFNQTQKCWLVKDGCLKEHGLEDLKIEKIAKKDVKEDKPSRPKDPSKSKDEKKPRESTGDSQKSSNKENDESKESTIFPPVESPSVDVASSASSENATPRRVSIKSFFTPKTRSSTTPTSVIASPSHSPRVLTSTVLKETAPTAAPSKAAESMAAKVPTAETPKAKKRVQLTTLSRTPTLKEEKKSQAVLEKDETILIDDSN